MNPPNGRKFECQGNGAGVQVDATEPRWLQFGQDSKIASIHTDSRRVLWAGCGFELGVAGQPANRPNASNTFPVEPARLRSASSLSARLSRLSDQEARRRLFCCAASRQRNARLRWLDFDRGISLYPSLHPKRTKTCDIRTHSVRIVSQPAFQRLQKESSAGKPIKIVKGITRLH